MFLTFEEYIAELDKEKRYSTRDSYRDAMSSIRSFREKLNFADVTVQFLQHYEKYMISKGNSTSTIRIYLRNIRCLSNKARWVDKIIVRDSFDTREVYFLSLK